VHRSKSGARFGSKTEILGTANDFTLMPNDSDLFALPRDLRIQRKRRHPDTA